MSTYFAYDTNQTNSISAADAFAVYEKQTRTTAEILKFPVRSDSDIGTRKISIPLLRPKVVRQKLLQLNFLNFSTNIDAPIIDIKRISPQEIKITALIDTDFSVILSIYGKTQGDSFIIEKSSLKPELKKDTAQANFIASTITAMMLAAGGEILLQIPVLGLKLPLRFESNLKELSIALHRRQLIHRIMVIERATQKRFQLPKDEYKGQEIKVIAFIYKAIIERSFTWQADRFFFTYTKERFSELEKLIEQIKAKNYCMEPFIVGTRLRKEVLFGQEISLGLEEVKFENLILEEPEYISNQLKDENIPQIKVGFLVTTGKVRYFFKDAPVFPENCWNELIQKLIDLESDLNNLTLNRYFSEMATLADLPEEDKAE